jgi:DNA-binding response OmpR family regulator
MNPKYHHLDKALDENYHINAKYLQFVVGKTAIILTTIEFALLALLYSHLGRIYSRSQIMDFAYYCGPHCQDNPVKK